MGTLKLSNFHKSFFTIFGIGVFLLGSHPALASTLSYGTFIGIHAKNIIVAYDDTQIKNYYSCSTATFICTPTTARVANSSGFPSVSATNKQLRALKLPGDIAEMRISPSKKFTAYYVPGDIGLHRLGFFTFMSGTKKYRLAGSASYWDLINEGLRPFLAFSPDSTHLAYLNVTNGTAALYLKKTANLSPTNISGSQITDNNYSVGPFTFGNSNTLYFVANKDSLYSWSLFSYSISTQKITEIAKDVSFGNPLHTVGNFIGYIAIKDKSEVPMLYDPAKNISHPLLPSGVAMPAAYDTKNNKIIQIGNAHGVLMTPPNFSASAPHPLIIWLHGGPYRQTSNGYDVYLSYAGYDWMLEQARAAGAIVLKLDYTGSFGYGVSFGEGLIGQMGITDVKDVTDAVHYFSDNNIAVSKTYLVGNSYGGYLALKSQVEAPTLFNGVLSINGVTDWAALLPKITNSIFNAAFNGLPDPTNQSLYDQASILSRIGNIGNQRIIIAQASSDRTVNPKQATLLYDALMKQGKNTSLVQFPGEDHVFVKKASISSLCTQLFNLVTLPIGNSCNFE